jgi:lipid A 3-O-deacylase
MKSHPKNKVVAGALITLAMACVLPAAQAQQSGTQPGSHGGISVQVGLGQKYNRSTLNYEMAPVWTTDFGGSWGHLDLTPEFGASYWSAHSGEHPSSVWQLSAIPMFRWWLGERFFLEGGVGPTVFSHTKFADKTISTAFQFGDHIGFGFQLTQNSRVSLRYSHFSNASIKTPNPGLDVTQLTYTYLF